MKRKISIAKSFKKDMAKQLLHLASAEWAEVLNSLVHKKALPEKYRDHALIGNWKGFRVGIRPYPIAEVAKHEVATHQAAYWNGWADV